MTYLTAFVFLTASVMLYLCKHLYAFIVRHRGRARRAQMQNWLDWDNTNRATRRRREEQKQSRWQRYGITN